MKTVGFFVNRSKPEATAALGRLSVLAETLGFRTDGTPDCVIVLGGDGTMLAAVHQYPGIPLLGLNLGSLGYLAGVEEPHFEEALRALAEDRFTIARRVALVASVLEPDGKRRALPDALNDVVVSRGSSGHVAALDLAVDGRPVSHFIADGLVIATPTGSTAYSLAAGGPILLPDSASLVITPICPHALSSRPIVVRNTARLEVRPAPHGAAVSPMTVSADGSVTVNAPLGSVVEVSKSDVAVPLVQLAGYDPYEVLSRKLGWSGTVLK